ncbi:DUF1707 SHOCT-like domain-containing protein [Actinokineospora bangkokensis]|uniref:Uncharacterized protein n=1 Tax=Actinokineospora bangkokensis TaxID=1193682 RepID=A0A1Q9LGE6_9PSEU|nr:DUF1707 domain-containing protein [Actinokineospora bangkokensis]OLR91121.1 hypothetical protein BJP25_28100 [Actinokineospora bangkokensis]
MSEQPSVPGPDQMRASDADRERFAKVLHDAMAEGRLTVAEMEERLDLVYAAKTYGDLTPLLRDLPGQDLVPVPTQPRAPQPAAARAAVPANPDRVGGRGTSSSAIAVMSGAERKGVWVVPPTFNAVAVMGGVQLDLSQARFEAAETTIQAFALMGGVEVFVPEDITVHVTGSGFMGGFGGRVTSQVGPPGAPVVRITGFALMGGVEVKHARKRGRIAE